MRKEHVEKLIARLKSMDPSEKQVVMGFDGFVDEVVHPVEKRYDSEKFDRILYMKDYAKKIQDAAGLSMNIEMVPVQVKLGGNGPILANSLIALGFNMTYIGALGKGGIEDAFQDMASKAKVISIAGPGHTDAIEFLDGKIISSKLKALDEVTWENLRASCPEEKLAQMLDEADLFGMENWTLVNNTTGIWKGILEYVVPLMKSEKRKPLFIDLADPEKRTTEDILEALSYVKKFQEYFDVTLGLNLKEARELAEILEDSSNTEDVQSLAASLREQLLISCVVVHPVKEACAADAYGTYRVEGPYCEKPVLTTGAGDNFNGGFLLGQLLGCTVEESLLLGVTNSGFYVRNARSGSFEEIVAFLDSWFES